MHRTGFSDIFFDGRQSFILSAICIDGVEEERGGLGDSDAKRAARYDVVIVGAGPVGLAAAIELGSRGVRCLLIERNDRVGYAPRAKTTNVRTRTHLRRWGIADQLAERSPLGTDYPSNVHFVTRLAGAPLALFYDAFNTAPRRSPNYPEHGQWIPQYTLESVLREHVRTLEAVEVRFCTEFIRYEAHDDYVVVDLRATGGGAEQSVEADYLIGADGARSSVRSAIGATMSGRNGLSRNYNIVFRAPGLARAHSHGPGIMYWQINGDVPSVIGPMDRGDVWYFMLTGVLTDQVISEQEAVALITHATGIRGTYEILSSDSWTASRLIADKYRDGCVFLIGDACHLHPPFGGYGMNMGVADGVDLGWKLAAVLQGWGGAALLDSYELERKPVHEWVLDEAEANHAVLGNQLWREGLEDAGPEGARLRSELESRILTQKAREFHTLGAVLGYSYEQSPVIAAEAGVIGRDVMSYQPSSQPGCLAPHLWLDDDRSIYDLFGGGFALLVRRADARTAIAGAKALRIPLTIVELPSGSQDLYPCRFTLVRPDQHVAWRGDQWRPGTLAMATGRVNRTASDPSDGALSAPSISSRTGDATPEQRNRK